MRVGLPGTGTGAAEAAPHRRPNWVRVLTNVKKPLLLAARPPVLQESNPDCPCGAAGALSARSGEVVKQRIP